MRIVKEGWIFLIPIIFLDIWWHIFSLQIINNLLYYFILITFPTSVLLIILAAFFRDPNRNFLPKYSPELSILSPADGVIRLIKEEKHNITIYIDLHYYNVHVIRSHLSGRVIKINQISRRHRLVYFLIQNKVKAKSSIIKRKNTQVLIEFQDKKKKTFELSLICGGIFRRAIPYIKLGDLVEKGKRVGVILFGSNVKITLPDRNYKILVKEGTKVRGGQTIICEKVKEFWINRYLCSIFLSKLSFEFFQ